MSHPLENYRAIADKDFITIKEAIFYQKYEPDFAGGQSSINKSKQEIIIIYDEGEGKIVTFASYFASEYARLEKEVRMGIEKEYESFKNDEQQNRFGKRIMAELKQLQIAINNQKIEHKYNKYKQLDEILNLDFENLVMAFDRFETSGEDLIVHLRNKVDVLVHGYNDDPREIFKRIDNWPYFLAMDKAAQFVKVLHRAHSDYVRVGNDKIEYDTASSTPFLQKMFDMLNILCDKHGISDEVNIDICTKFMDCLTDGDFSKSRSQQG